MSASATSKKPCAKCDKGAGIFTCDGCQQSFCGKHVGEHRQELAVELDGIMQKHDSLQQELEQSPSEGNPLLMKINQWEKEAIAKVQAAAETARTNLQELLRKSKERLSKTSLTIKTELQASSEADDYSEKDLTRWKEQLEALKTEIASPSSAKVVTDKKAAIHVIKLTTDEAPSNQTTTTDQPPPKPDPSTSDKQERFLQTLGPVNIEDSSHLAKRVGLQESFAHIRGRFLYSKGRYVIRFKIEQSTQPYEIFLGCMSSQGLLTDNAYKSPHAVGWFGHNQVYEHGRCASNCRKYQYRSTAIHKSDELCLILDCDKAKIRLFHEQNKTTCTLSVNTQLAPLPWQLLIVLCRPGDAVRILPNP